MYRFRSRLLRTLVGLFTCFALSFPLQAFASHEDENPSALRMVGDALVARPMLIVLTTAGLATWLVSLPFSLPGGNAGAAAETLVIEPARTTFLRCLGCKDPLSNRELRGNRSSASTSATSGGKLEDVDLSGAS